MTLRVDWSRFSRFLTFNGGPLSEAGPLGPNGPLSDYAYWRVLPSINDFGKQLQAGGVWGVLGPLGPLGALGPLGPLGPMGAHGFARDGDGNYRRGSSVVRTVNVNYNGSHRTHELFEIYTESAARRMRDNDTSFMAMGEIRDANETDAYGFYSRYNQWVTVIVVPLSPMERFDLAITDIRGRPIATSTSKKYVNFVQMQVPRGTPLVAMVRARDPMKTSRHAYRLVVVGSGAYVNPATDIRGAHQGSY